MKLHCLVFNGREGYDMDSSGEMTTLLGKLEFVTTLSDINKFHNKVSFDHESTN